MWGTYDARESNLSSVRFIPTNVGNMNLPFDNRFRIAVHPHECGEHVIAGIITSRAHGSSPRMWGTSVHLSSAGRHLRFIPTNVGNIRRVLSRQVRHTVHPHESGEHTKSHANCCSNGGSSPRMWGTFSRQVFYRIPMRFIPADVGNMLSAMQLCRDASVHPHECGEHSLTPDAWNT